MASVEIEETRRAHIRGLSAHSPGWPAQFAPGTFGCHEAMDRASLIGGLADDLSSHPAILRDPQWYQMAYQAAQLLYDLYQAIGAAHLNDEQDESGKPADPT